MRLSRFTTLCATVACVAVVLNVDGSAQRGGARSGAPGGQGGRVGAIAPPAAAAPSVADDPFAGPVVTNAPFSAEAVTTVTQVLADGTRIEQKTTAKFYRDSAGRVRREQMILGLAALDPTASSRTTITIDPDPGDTWAYTLDSASRTARQVPRSSSTGTTTTGLYFRANDTRELNALILATGDLTARRVTRLEGGQVTVTEGVAQPTEQLGTKQVEGVAAVGRKAKSVIPAGQIGNDRPIEVTDERWESAELRLLVRSHHHDPRTGDVEYRLTNIVRSEPPADLFTVPSDYQIQNAETGRGTGGLGAGGGGRGARSGGGQ